jgi:type II secretory ATPase GspE/PulE/Tfp pilus assembly ATPase PilB-like protein
LHAATPVEGIRRLLDLGLKPSDFVPSLVGIFSQRLVRRLASGKYRGRFPLTEYIYFSEELKKNLLENCDLSACETDKTFQESCAKALDKNLTDAAEIKRVFGNADI